jgi:hypothetical protein
MKNLITLLKAFVLTMISLITSAQKTKNPNYQYAYFCDVYNQDWDAT